jgi:hypothetical protein
MSHLMKKSNMIILSKTNKKDFKRDEAKVKIILSYFGEKTLASKITPKRIEDFKSYLSEKYSNAYVNRYLACLKTIFNTGLNTSSKAS